MNRPAALALAALLALTAPATADFADTDRAAMQTIVSDQIAAFQSDDGIAAYEFASPSIRALFPTADIFMEMVRGGYMPVYRPQTFAFGPLIDTPRGPLQRVFITGPDGAAYVAEYLFQQQPDGSWKINGVTLVRDTSPTI